MANTPNQPVTTPAYIPDYADVLVLTRNQFVIATEVDDDDDDNEVLEGARYIDLRVVAHTWSDKLVLTIKVIQNDGPVETYRQDIELVLDEDNGEKAVGFNRYHLYQAETISVVPHRL